jgi:hypothetical protein
LDVSAFERLVYQGRGKAILHLQSHDPTPYQDVILRACLREDIWDPQSNGDRVDYLTELAKISGNETDIRYAVLSALAEKSEQENDYDVFQWFDLAERWAQEGDETARKAIFDGWLARVKPDNISGAHTIIELDGFEGFLFVTERLGEFIRADPEWTLEYDLCYTLKEFAKDEKTAELVRSSHQFSRNVQAYLNYCRKQERPRASSTRQKEPNIEELDYRYIKALATSPFKPYSPTVGILQKWSKQARKEDLLQAAHDLIELSYSDENANSMVNYLWMFDRVEFPLEPALLVDLFNRWMSKSYPPYDETGAIRKPAWMLQRALSVLQYMIHPDVRKFAFQLIESPHWIGKGKAVGLLTNNFELHDWKTIEDISRENLEDKDLHTLGFSVRDIFDANPSLEAAPVFISLYERGPCGMCRNRDLRCLHSLNAIPDWVAEECKYDSFPQLREWARNGFPARKH